MKSHSITSTVQKTVLAILLIPLVSNFKLAINEESHQFLVTDLGPEDLVHGLPWLRHENPVIDWKGGKMKIDPPTTEDSAPRVKLIAANRVQCWKWWRTKVLDNPFEQLWCAAKYTYSAELAEKADRDKQKHTFEEIVSKDYQQYAKVFSKVKSEHLPEHKPYDHAINLKPETPKMLQSKIYPMPMNEQAELD